MAKAAVLAKASSSRFWGTVTMLAALHIPLVLLVPWTTKWVPALAIAAIVSGDLIVMLAILAVVERFMEGPRTADPDGGEAPIARKPEVPH